MSDAEVDEVEAWISGYKAFDHYFPAWIEMTGHGRRWQSRWPIVDADGVTSGMACFETDATFTEISISVIYRRAPVYRLDKVKETQPDGNPLVARRYAPHLPVDFTGSHVHAWEDNKEWIRAEGLKELPFKRPITAPSTLELMFDLVARELNITLRSSERAISLPPQSGLNLDWKGGHKP